jgi:biopolymer transport protein ExbB
MARAPSREGDEMGNSLGEIFRSGGWVMWPLLIFSIMTWAVVFERVFAFVTLRPRLARLTNAVTRSLRSGDLRSAREACQRDRGRLGRIFLDILESRRSREFTERVTERHRARLMTRFRRNLWVLGTIGSVSPFLGLLGTVLGIVRAFHHMAEQGAGGFSVVAGGISEALIATAAGLVVAIIALVAYNTFTTVATQILGGLRLTLDELLDHRFEPSGKEGGV